MVSLVALLWGLAALLSGTRGTHVPLPISEVKGSLERISTELASKYNMSIAIAFYSESPALGFSADAPGDVAVAAGFTDSGMGMGTPTRAALPDDL